VIRELVDNLVRQTRDMSTADYLETFLTHLDEIRTAGGEIYEHPGSIKAALLRSSAADPPSAEEMLAATKSARNDPRVYSFYTEVTPHDMGPCFKI
jgi:hypothetical protein